MCLTRYFFHFCNTTIITHWEASFVKQVVFSFYICIEFYATLGRLKKKSMHVDTFWYLEALLRQLQLTSVSFCSLKFVCLSLWLAASDVPFFATVPTRTFAMMPDLTTIFFLRHTSYLPSNLPSAMKLNERGARKEWQIFLQCHIQHDTNTHSEHFSLAYCTVCMTGLFCSSPDKYVTPPIIMTVLGLKIAKL